MMSLTDRNPENCNRLLRCTICRRPIPPEKQDHRPFCSRRCQQLDLANWLEEKYGLPWEGEEDDEQDLE